MKDQFMRKSLVILIVVLMFGAIGSAPQTGYAESSSYAESASKESHEDQLYKDGTAARDAGQWQKAIDLFSQIKGSKADAAAYWKAYAENKLGDRTAALETIAALEKQYPKSKFVNDAKALEIEIRGAAGQAPAAAAAPSTRRDRRLRFAGPSALRSPPETDG
jgi:outer membrane protein assembly factor BamD (BamD/ComL family)